MVGCFLLTAENMLQNVKELTFSENAQVCHQNISIVSWCEFHEALPSKFTQLLPIHIKSFRIDILEAELFDRPLDPLSYMFFRPAQRIWIKTEIYWSICPLEFNGADGFQL